MRLTVKNGIGLLVESESEYSLQNNICHNDCIQKLGQLEDIEDELGIDLITLFQALNNGIWIKKRGERKDILFFYEDVNLYKDYLYVCPIDIYDERVSIHQYGKTWALTKEELLKH